MQTTDTDGEITDGVYRCGSTHVNCYLLEADGRLTVVDAGFPTHWQQLLDRLATLNRELADVEALCLTHAHPDHLGFADRLQAEAGVRVLLHARDVERARAGGDPPLVGFLKHMWRPAIVRYFIEVLRSEGTSIPPVTDVETFEDGDRLDVPGEPRVIHAPGHTDGEVAFHLPDRDVLLCGDAMATVDFETWRGTDPQLMPPWLNVDHERARASMAEFDAIGEVSVLPGHGDPWAGDLSSAVQPR